MTTTRTHKELVPVNDGQARREFMHALLGDLRAMERMIAEGRFEKGMRRIGAEQEMFLVDKTWCPATAALKMLDGLKDPHFTTELGQFQLEANCDPQELAGDGLSKLEAQLDALMEKVHGVAEQLELKAVLMGILPTMRKSDLGMHNMVPSPRYLTLSKVIADLKGGRFDFSIKGLDELIIEHDSVMLEACNSSFQVHFQVEPQEFARMYNLAQVLAAPLMAISANSPLLFGKRLWAETRIALFRQSVDDRTHRSHFREEEARVSFGTRWVRRSVTEIFQEDIARFRTLVATEFDEDPMAVLDRGGVPQLKALRLHNGTIYRWNRACYGIGSNGTPHLRIENRVMPAGPSVVDQVANGAFWFGLMSELGARDLDVTRLIDFDQSGSNFYAAAREGLGAHFTWLKGKDVSAGPLVLDELLPIAEAGLRRAQVNADDAKRYLGVIDARVRSARTGARWLLSSWNALKDKGTPGERANALVAATVQRQRTRRPVAEWERARLDEADVSHHSFLRVEQYMTTDLFTVHADDPVQMVALLMDWERIRHVPVEDKDHRLLGLVSYRSVMRLLTSGGSMRDTPVSKIMRTEVTTITPETSSAQAIALMERYRVGCLPVLHDGKLVGLVTEQHMLGIASKLLNPDGASEDEAGEE
ncbi:MAG: CBS domain-containing protein [Myxococcaceae bacterium]|nr:CBS domain-containing protein [Myxococcaceae bacterium]